MLARRALDSQLPEQEVQRCRTASSSEGAAAPKRRRISLGEVENELRMSGLCQPALSLVHTQYGQACDRSLISKRGRKGEQERGEPLPDMGKRRRFCSEAMEEGPVIGELQARLRNVLSGACADGRLKHTLTKIVGIDSIVPVCSDPSECAHVLYHQLSLPRSLLEPAQTRNGPFGLTFLHGDGVLVADFPREWRPTLLAASGTPAAKIAIDCRGTAFFLSEVGELLTAIPAIRYLEDVMCNQSHEVKVNLLSLENSTESRSSPVVTAQEGPDEDEFSPSTDVPEDSDELEGDMDTD